MQITQSIPSKFLGNPFLTFLLNTLTTLAAEKSKSTEKYTEPTVLTQFLVPFCAAIMMALTFSGTSLGLAALMPAVCQAAEIKRDITSFIIALCFSSAPMIFGLLMSLMLKDKIGGIAYKVPEIAFPLAANFIIAGVGYGTCSYAVCLANKYLLVAKMKQKNFNLQFFLANIFIELVGILTFVVTLLPTIGLPKADDIKYDKSTSSKGSKGDSKSKGGSDSAK